MPNLYKQLKKIECPFKKLNACSEGVIPIPAKDIGRDGLVINQPGCYCLTGDVIFNSELFTLQPSVQEEISFRAPNVNLHLGCYKLSQRSFENLPGGVPYVAVTFVTIDSHSII